MEFNNKNLSLGNRGWSPTLKLDTNFLYTMGDGPLSRVSYVTYRAVKMQHTTSVYSEISATCSEEQLKDAPQAVRMLVSKVQRGTIKVSRIDPRDPVKRWDPLRVPVHLLYVYEEDDMPIFFTASRAVEPNSFTHMGYNNVLSDLVGAPIFGEHFYGINTFYKEGRLQHASSLCEYQPTSTFLENSWEKLGVMLYPATGQVLYVTVSTGEFDMRSTAYAKRLDDFLGLDPETDQFCDVQAAFRFEMGGEEESVLFVTSTSHAFCTFQSLRHVDMDGHTQALLKYVKSRVMFLGNLA